MRSVKLLARGIATVERVGLVASPLKPSHNPVSTAGMLLLYQRLVFREHSEGKDQLVLRESGRDLEILGNSKSWPALYVGLAEAMDGIGDISIAVLRQLNREREGTWLWFWGFANPHRANGF